MQNTAKNGQKIQDSSHLSPYEAKAMAKAKEPNEERGKKEKARAKEDIQEVED